MPAQKQSNITDEKRKHWRFGITAKMFCGFLAVGVMAGVVIGVAHSLYFQRSFTAYLIEQESTRILVLADSLAEEYTQNNRSWAFIGGDGSNWRRIVGRFLRRQPDGQNAFTPVEAARRSYQITHLRERLGLVDTDKKTLLAGVAPTQDALWDPVILEGRIIGWLVRAPFTAIPESNDLRFQEEQRNTGLIVLGATMVLAAVASIFLAHFFVSPLRKIGRATSALMKGDYTARADVGTKDEIQTLASEVNSLAVTLQQNEDARRIFMAEIAHELRTPLAVLTGELEAMEDGIRKVTPEAISSLKAEIGILSRLVDDIHTLSLMDLGTLAYEKRPMDLNRLIEKVVGAFGERVAGAGLVLELELPCSPEDGLGVFVEADKTRLSQVLNNVLENSLRYTEAPGVVRVACGLEGDFAVLDIMDSPPSVSEEYFERIFDRFHTTDSSRSRKSGGSGLGLSISRSIIDAHGGSIVARKSPLGGVWVRIKLPVAAALAGSAENTSEGA